MKLCNVLPICIALALLWGSSAQAQDESLNRARGQFEEAQQLYQDGKFAEAADKFQEAYQTRPFPAFLYNAALAYEEIPDYAKAIEFYKRYLEEVPKAQDKAQVEERIRVFQAEIERLGSLPPPTGDAGPVETGPSEAVQSLGKAKIRGLVIIESKPQGAYIYLDDKKSEPLGRTPWNGTLEGEHSIFIESEGYKPDEKVVVAVEDKILVLYFSLAEEDYLGWIDIRANVPGASIYIDDKVAVFRRTPYSGNIKPGKHKIWITKEGYDEYFTEVNIVPGQTHEVVADLKGGEVGYINVRGRDVEKVRVYVDGEKVCDGPCRHPVAEGKHKVSIRRSGHKTYSRSLEVRSKTEVTLRPKLAKEPSRSDAVWAYIFAAAFTGGGAYLGMQANSIKDELDSEIAAGMPPPDQEDPRMFRGKLFAIGADAAYAVGAATFVVAIYYTFRDKGRPSSATTDVSSIAITPQVTPDYAGVGMEVTW